MRTADVAVIGAGIIGAATAWQARRRGHSVVLLEQFEIGHQRGSSHGEARIFRLAYEQPEYVELARMAVPFWREIEEALGEDVLRITGAVDFGPPELLEPIATALTAGGAPFERLDRLEAAHRFPAFRLPEGFTAICQPDGGFVLADRARLGLARLARQAGVEVVQHCPITRLVPARDSVRLETATGDREVGTVVVAAAGWSSRLLAPLGLAVPMRITREHVAYYRRRGEDDVIPFIWHGSSSAPEVYGLPNGEGGLIKVGDHGVGPVVDPDSLPEVDATRLASIDRFAREHLPGVAPDRDSAETCLYASSIDDDFVLWRQGPIVLGLGFGGHGFKFGALVGSLLTDLVEGGTIPHADRFSLGRFAGASA